MESPEKIHISFDTAGEFVLLEFPSFLQGGDSIVKRPASDAGVVEEGNPA